MALKEVIISAPAFTMNNTPHWVAMDKGFFEEEGIKVNFVFLGTERDKTFPGQLAFRAPGGSAPFSSQREHTEQLINIVSTQDRPAHVLVVRPGIKDGKELKGKKIIAGARGASWVDGQIAVRNYGLDPEKDVNWVGSENIPPDTERARVEALAKGEVDGVLAGPPHWVIAMKMGCTKLQSGRDVVRWPEDGLVTTRPIIEKYPDVCKAVVRSIVRGTEFVRLNREESLDIFCRHALYVDRDTAATCYDTLRDGWLTLTDLSLYRKKIEYYCKTYKQEPQPFESYYDTRFVKAALEEMKLLRDWKP